MTLLTLGRFELTDEKRTQLEIDEALLRDLARADVKREHRLGARDIPDFFVLSAIVIEVKGPRHSASAVLRQLERYAAYPQVQVILLATSRAMAMPERIGGKPCRVINLGTAWL